MRNIAAAAVAIMLGTLLCAQEKEGLKRAYFAGGCFWGVEYYMEKLPGVEDVASGFMGGHLVNPSYWDVVEKETGHVETVEVTYDPQKIGYETLAKNFFEIHDFTQTDGQGPDIGEQYHSVIFYSSDAEREIAEKLVSLLTKKGFRVATTIRKSESFYRAEGYHQDYYQRHGKLPYCHSYNKLFD